MVVGKICFSVEGPNLGGEMRVYIRLCGINGALSIVKEDLNCLRTGDDSGWETNREDTNPVKV